MKPLVLNLRRLKPAARLVALNDWVTEHACDYPIVTSDAMRSDPSNVRLDRVEAGWSSMASERWLIGVASRPNPRRRLWWHDFEVARWSTSLDLVWPLATKAFRIQIEWQPYGHRLVVWPRTDQPVIVESSFATLPEALCSALLQERGITVRA